MTAVILERGLERGPTACRLGVPVAPEMTAVILERGLELAALLQEGRVCQLSGTPC